MPETLQWSFHAQLVRGPSISPAGDLVVEGYDKIDVEVDAETGGAPGSKEVEVQPGGAGRVLFLLITASSYNPPLTYTVDGGAERTLDAPLCLIGSGTVAAFSPTVNAFTFSNDDTNARTVQILVGRNVSA
jgi:hypothetical protein